MPPTLFPLSVIGSKAPQSRIPKCEKCGLYKGCKSPKMEYTGSGNRRILIVGEAPGEEEDARGVQFVGKTGQHLRDSLRKLGVDTRKDCWLTNALICRPPGNEIKDEKAVNYCRPNLVRTIEELKPEIIIPLGKYAVRSLIEWLWKEEVGSVSRWVEWQIPSQRLNAWICPNYHPSYVLREDSKVLFRLFDNTLKKAVSLRGRPWKEIPDYKKEVRVETDPNKAAKAILDMIATSYAVAFDFETNMIKPDSNKRRIVCCSVSDGKRTIAYPWIGEAIRATRELLQSEVKKIGWNLKFEERWVLAEFGAPVRNWFRDGSLLAHVLDNRSEICGLKFQAFVILGQDSYDHHMRQFLKAKVDGGNEENRIRQANMTDLLLYCGLDSLLEYKVAEVQNRQLRRMSG